MTTDPPKPTTSPARTLAWVALALVVAWFAFARIGTIRIRPAGDSPAARGIVLRGLDGQASAIESYRGRIVVVNLWASWCGPCVREIPALARVRERFGPLGVDVVGINADEGTAAEVAAIASRLGIPYPVVLAPDGLREPLVPRGLLPHTWILDREGRVRASHAGAASGRAFESAVRRLLAEDGAAGQPPQRSSAVAPERASRVSGSVRIEARTGVHVRSARASSGRSASGSSSAGGLSKRRGSIARPCTRIV